MFTKYVNTSIIDFLPLFLCFYISLIIITFCVLFSFWFVNLSASACLLSFIYLYILFGWLISVIPSVSFHLPICLTVFLYHFLPFDSLSPFLSCLFSLSICLFPFLTFFLSFYFPLYFSEFIKVPSHLEIAHNKHPLHHLESFPVQCSPILKAIPNSFVTVICF